MRTARNTVADIFSLGKFQEAEDFFTDDVPIEWEEDEGVMAQWERELTQHGGEPSRKKRKTE